MRDLAAGLLRAGLRHRRVVVVGTPASGKSTMARTLGVRLGLRVHHTDDICWLSGWRLRPAAELTAMIEALTQTEEWIIEGNHPGSLPARLSRADAIVVLRVPAPVAIFRIARRSVTARLGRPTLLPSAVRAEREPWWARKVVLRAACRYRRSTLPALNALLDQHPQLPVFLVGWRGAACGPVGPPGEGGRHAAQGTPR